MSRLNFKSTEELIDLINTSDALGDHRDEFIKDIQAKPNLKKRVAAVVIYWVYLKWAYLNKVKPIARKRFFFGLKHKFKQHRYNVYNYYYIESNHFDLPEKEKELMWQHLKEEKEKEKHLRELKKLQQKRLEKKQKSEDGTN